MSTSFAIVVWGLSVAGAWAQSNPVDVEQPLWVLAADAERDLEFATAQGYWRQLLLAQPSSRQARRARTRLRWLEERRDPDGGFEALRSFKSASRGGGAESLARLQQQTEGFLNPRVRCESRLFIARQLVRRQTLEDAWLVYERLLDDSCASVREVRTAASEAVGVLERLNRPAQASALVDEHLRDTFEGRDFVARAQRATIAGYSAGWLCAAMVLLVLLWRPWSKHTSRAGSGMFRLSVAVALYAVGVPALIAGLYADGTISTFAAFGVVMFPLVWVGIAASRSQRRVWVRGGVLAVLLVSHVAAGYIALFAGDGLESFGL